MTINAWTGNPDPSQQDAQVVPVGAIERVRKALAGRKFREATDIEDLLRMAANVIAEDGSVIGHMEAKIAAPTPPAQQEWIDDAGRLQWALWRIKDLEQQLAGRPVAITPPAQRVTLTPDEIDLIDSGMCGEREFSHNYAHAIIEAYERKNAQPNATPTTPAQDVTWNEYVETACALIKAADDAAADCDYMLDSDDCIKVLRGQWKAPLANDCPPRPQPAPAQQGTLRLPTLPFAVFDESGKGCEDRIDDYFSAALAQQDAQASAHPGGQEELKQWQRDGSPMPSPAQASGVPKVSWGVDWGLSGDRACASIVRRLPDGATEVLAVEMGPQINWPQRAAPIDWSQAGALMEAAASAKSAGFTTGTTNWAAHICRHMEAISARQKPSWTRLPADDTEGGAA